MSRWLILLACGCGTLCARADNPSLTPPPEPPPVAVPTAAAKAAASSAPASTKNASLSAGPIDSATGAAALPGSPNDPYLPDSIGELTVRPVPESDEPVPSFIKQAEYLRQHKDNEMAANYLGNVVMNPDISPRDRARVILELTDCLASIHHYAEELCWLKIWMQLYPDRPEVGAVAYRMGALYTRVGLSEPARDSYYLALSNAVNHGQVQDTKDLQQYTRLTVGTLWALAQNEYDAGNWDRAARLFDRYRHQAQSPSPSSLAKTAFLQADCYYQLRQNAKADAAYQQALKDHPFHRLAPEARLRLYHLDMLANKPEQARQELEALVWTVRTVWPKDEAYWQKRTAELLMAINHQNVAVLPPLLAKSLKLTAQDKAWQAELGHYDRLASLETTTLQATMASSDSSSTPAAKMTGLSEQDDLVTMRQSIDALVPAKISDPAHP